MLLEITKYYFFKNALNSLPREVVDEFNITDDLIFNAATILSTPAYFKILSPYKKDKYDLYYRLTDKASNDLLVTLLYKAKELDDYKVLFFVYGLLSARILENHLIPYIEVMKKENESNDSIYNMIDFYFAKKHDDIDLSKTNIYKRLKDGFILYPYMDEVLKDPIIRGFNIFSVHSYLEKSYKRKKIFYRLMTKDNFFKRGLYKSYDFIFRNRKRVKAIDYIYKNKIDTSILNLMKEEHIINNIATNSSLDDIFSEARSDLKSYFLAINDYIFFNKDKAIKAKLHIPEDFDLFK